MRSTIHAGLAFAISLAGLTSSGRPPAPSQPSVLLVTVLDSLARYPLVNADVIDLATGQHRFTDERGQARLTWPTDGQLRLRVRQVGYQPRQRTLQQNAAGGATTFEMSKVAYVISTVRATGRCTTTNDSAALDLSLAALDQLKQGAEKYDEFRKSYPFEVTLERRSAIVPEKDGVEPRILAHLERFHSEDWELRYKPGNVIQYRYRDFSVPILFLSTLADSVFWEHHCFLATGFQSYQGEAVVRLDFSASPDTRDAEYEGTAYLDSATSYLRRVDFRLANLHDRRGPKRLEGYITFSSPSPFIIVPDTTVAVWWVRDVDKNDWGRPDYVQSLRLKELKYRKQKPPDYEKAKQ